MQGSFRTSEAQRGQNVVASTQKVHTCIYSGVRRPKSIEILNNPFYFMSCLYTNYSIFVFTGQFYLPCEHAEVYGNQRRWPETDHEDLFRGGQTNLDLEKEVTQWNDQELRTYNSVVMVKMSLPLKRGNIYHHILNKTTNNCQNFGSSVSCHTAKNMCDKLKDCMKSMYFSMQTVFFYVELTVMLFTTLLDL